MATVTVSGKKTGMDVNVINSSDAELSASTGAVDDTAYSDATGAADGTVIALLKGIFVQLAVIATNTTPTP